MRSKEIKYLLFLYVFFTLSCVKSSTCPHISVTKGPYVLYVTADGGEIRWETEEEGCAEVVLTDGEGTFKKEFKGTARKYEPSYDWEYKYELTDTAFVWNYIVKVEGLESGKRYFYKVKGESGGSAHSFKTAPPPGEPFKFAVIGDTLNVGEGVEGNLREIEKFDPDIVIHTGDLEYYSFLIDSWNNFFSEWRKLLARAVLIPSRGNHEDEFQGELLNYFNRYFRYPDSGTNPYYYSIRYGSGLFVVLDSETSSAQRQEQIKWFEDVASSFASEVTDGFIVVIFHRPPYTLSLHFPDAELISMWHPLFEKYHVKIVFNGHNHVYERFVVDGINYVVEGAGGASLYNVNEQIDKLNSGGLSGEEKSLIESIYPLRVTGVSTFATLMADVYPGMITLKAVDYTGNLIEEFKVIY